MTLALSQRDFEERYQGLALDFGVYIARLRDPAKRLLSILSLRLFLAFVETKPEYGKVLDLLRGPGTVPPETVQKSLMMALREGYERLERSGLYSSKVALNHARGCARVLRWLGRERPLRYPKIKRVVWRNIEWTSTRKNSTATVIAKPLSPKEMSARYGATITSDVLEYEERVGAKATLGFRKVLAWLSRSYVNQGGTVIQALQSGGTLTCDPAAIKDVLDAWERATAVSGAYSSKTIASEKRYAAALFEHLGNLPDRRYPHFSVTYVKSKSTTVEGKTLADVEFPQTMNLSGASKLRESLKIVMNAAFEVLREDRRVFEIMAPARTGIIPANLPSEQRTWWSHIAAITRAEIHSLKVTGRSQFSTSGVRIDVEEIDRAVQALSPPEIWIALGLPAKFVGGQPINLQGIRTLICRAIGAPRTANLAAKLIFVCDKGWNRQPTESIPTRVFVFHVGNDFGVASASFLDVFKNRAGHEVLSLIEHGSIDSATRREEILAAWEQVEGAKAWSEQDERSLLKATDPSFEAIELLRPMVEPLENYSSDPSVSSRFFKFLSWSMGVSTDDRDVRASFHKGVLGTRGVTFPSIRKTVLQLKIRDVGSLAAVRPFAGHAGLQTLRPSYLNSPEIIRELWQCTRFFQNAVQALTIEGTGCKIDIKMSAEDQKWFSRLARASGVASAVGFGVSIPISGPMSLRFRPSDEGIRGLVALHLSLINERRWMPEGRRLLIAIPLLAFIIALRRRLKQSGFGTLLRRVARTLLVDLRDGKAVLPTMKLHGEQNLG